MAKVSVSGVSEEGLKALELLLSDPVVNPDRQAVVHDLHTIELPGRLSQVEIVIPDNLEFLALPGDIVRAIGKFAASINITR